MKMARAIKQIMTWLQNPNEESTICRVSAKSLGGLQVVSEYKKTEIEGKEKAVAEEVIISCENWSDGVGKEVMFIGQWLNSSDRPIKTMQWRVSPSEEMHNTPMDGTPDSILAQMQVFAAKKDQMQLDMIKAFTELLVRQMEGYREHLDRLDYREKENLELRQSIIEGSVDSNPVVEQRINRLIDVLTRALTSGQS